MAKMTSGSANKKSHCRRKQATTQQQPSPTENNGFPPVVSPPAANLPHQVSQLSLRSAPPPVASSPPPPYTAYAGTTPAPPANSGWNGYTVSYQPPQPAGNLSHGARWASMANLRTATPPNANWMSSVSLPAAVSRPVPPPPFDPNYSTALVPSNYAQQGADLGNLVSHRFSMVIDCIDEDTFSGREEDLAVTTYPIAQASTVSEAQQRALSPTRSSEVGKSPSSYFSKVYFYRNSRLPPYLPPMKLYITTYPLMCLAAKYSEEAYLKPSGVERKNHINANFLSGTKAMTLKSLPIDEMNTIVFAIRGSSNFMDWCVNYRTAPAPPTGFLDDDGNYCHSGFLEVARRTAVVIAERLHALLQENPGRCRASLLICGHSAGGAVAQLLYAHMMSQSSDVTSALKAMTDLFKRVHCVTFGAPPVSLLPLQVQPAAASSSSNNKKNRKSLFFAFINEGDPVVRADKAVVASLLKLYTSPTPSSGSGSGGVTGNNNSRPAARLADMRNCALLGAAAAGVKSKTKANAKVKPQKAPNFAQPGPEWKVPPGTLSLGGRLVLLREIAGAGGAEDVGAYGVTDEQLRTVVFGDPVKHMMRLYTRRIEVLATKAVTAQGFG